MQTNTESSFNWTTAAPTIPSLNQYRDLQNGVMPKMIEVIDKNGELYCTCGSKLSDLAGEFLREEDQN